MLLIKSGEDNIFHFTGSGYLASARALPQDRINDLQARSRVLN
jgi:hypothetical protein